MCWKITCITSIMPVLTVARHHTWRGGPGHHPVDDRLTRRLLCRDRRRTRPPAKPLDQTTYADVRMVAGGAVCTRLMGVTEIRPAADIDVARWLLRSDVDWWDLVRYGPPGFDVYVRIAFPQESEADVVNPSDEAPADAIRTALATLASYTTTPATGLPRSGRAGARIRLRKRHEWRFQIEPCCSSPAVWKHSETHQLWLGTAPQRGSTRDRTSCGRRIKPGVWPARSTRRSSSPWVVPSTRPKLWPKPCQVLSDECTTGSLLPCTASRTSASTRSSATCSIDLTAGV